MRSKQEQNNEVRNKKDFKIEVKFNKKRVEGKKYGNYKNKFIT